MTSSETVPAPEDPRTEAFYAGAIDRINRMILIAAVVLVHVAWIRFGMAPALGFLLGAAISWFNFHSLAKAVRGLASRIVDAQSRERGASIVARFLLRYVVIGVVVYVTFISRPEAFYGLLTGLCLPVAGMMAEAVYEGYGAFRRGL